MSGLQGGSPKNLVMVAGSFDDDLANIKGNGFSVTVSSGVYTITLDRAYDALVSVQATVLNASAATGESLIANIVSYSVTNGTTGGTVVINTVDEQIFSIEQIFQCFCQRFSNNNFPRKLLKKV